MVDVAQRGLTTLGQIHHLVSFFFACAIELAEVGIGRDHQVAANVWIEIEDYEVVGAAAEHEILFIIRGVFVSFAEDARLSYGHVGSGSGDVFAPPGAPESFHR
jgi:hypothetical protein